MLRAAATLAAAAVAVLLVLAAREVVADAARDGDEAEIGVFGGKR